MLPENLAVWWFYLQMCGLIFNGMGGLDGGNIDSGMQNLNIPPGLRPGLYQKLLILAQEILRDKES